VLVLTPLGLFSKAVLNLESHSAEDKPPDAVNPTLTL
jgi:hypothetical protein